MKMATFFNILSESAIKINILQAQATFFNDHLTKSKDLNKCIINEFITNLVMT